MKKRIIWDEHDIKGGDHVIRESSPEYSDNLSFAASVAYMIVYNAETREWGRTSVNDGMTLFLGYDKEAVAEHFNDDEHGYRPLRGEQLADVLDYANRSEVGALWQ